MAFVGGVPMPIVHVVKMVAVQNGRMAASAPVYVSVFFGHHMRPGGALVVMPLVLSMNVPVVDVVDVIAVTHRDMATVIAVFMVVRFGGGMISDGALVVMPVVGVMLVPVVNVVNVADVLDCIMPAARAVDVAVVLMNRMSDPRGHCCLLFCGTVSLCHSTEAALNERKCDSAPCNALPVPPQR